MDPSCVQGDICSMKHILCHLTKKEIGQLFGDDAFHEPRRPWFDPGRGHLLASFLFPLPVSTPSVFYCHLSTAHCQITLTAQNVPEKEIKRQKCNSPIMLGSIMISSARERKFNQALFYTVNEPNWNCRKDLFVFLQRYLLTWQDFCIMKSFRLWTRLMPAHLASNVKGRKSGYSIVNMVLVSITREFLKKKIGQLL